MKIDENASIKDLQALKRKIERKISSKQSGQEDLAKFYDLIKSDHTKHLRPDGRKIFMGGEQGPGPRRQLSSSLKAAINEVNQVCFQ